MFVAGEGPKTEELDQIFRAINSEIAIAQVDSVLSDTVIKNVAKTVKLMCVKCENLLDGQASQVVGYPTNEQRRNVEVVNCLYSFYLGVEHHLHDQNESLIEVTTLIKNSVEPLVNSIDDAIEAILLTMHNENFNLEEFDTQNKSFSPYMKELQTFSNRVNLDFLSKFNCKKLIAESCLPLVNRAIDHFTIQASLIRPLSKAGQQKILQDCDNLEPAVEPIMNLVASWNGSAVDLKLKELSVFKGLVGLKAEDFPNSEALKGKLIKSSTALHMLFSQAPSEMKLPHESAGWSLSRYSTWLDEHQDEHSRLQFIQGALESYVASTRARNEKSYAYPYNIMLKVLQEAKK